MSRNQTMPWKLIGCAAAAFVAAGTLVHLHAAAPAPADPPRDAEPSLMQLAVARYQTADKGYAYAIAGHSAKDAPGWDALDWMRRKIKARLDIAEPKADRVAFLKECIDTLKRQEAFEEKMVARQLEGNETLLRVRYDRIDLEILLREFEAK